MTNELSFTKVSGAGNDFVIVDNRKGMLPEDKAALSRQLCSRHFGIGADGLLVLENSGEAHFRMAYFNSDGSYGGMCGNGGRCIARYAYLNNIAPREMSFEALDFVYHASILEGNRVRLTMKDPVDFRKNVEARVGTEIHSGFFVNTGSPHFVEFVDHLDAIDLARTGRAIREDPVFSPEGTNVNLVQIMENDHIRVRTYERGVESETLACGTGAVASAVISHLHRGLRFPVTVQVLSGESLRVNAAEDGQALHSPSLEGSAHILFNGKLLYDSTKHMILDLEPRT